MINELHGEVEPCLDQYQFTYLRNRNTNDAVLTMLHLLLKHLENRATYARLLFNYFSSAFNSI